MFAASNVQACEMCKPYFELWSDVRCLDIDYGVDFEMQALADDLKMPDANSESTEAVAKERTRVLTPVPMAMLRCILNGFRNRFIRAKGLTRIGRYYALLSRYKLDFYNFCIYVDKWNSSIFLILSFSFLDFDGRSGNDERKDITCWCNRLK
ncbi:hypothetical protein Tco_0928747 [Tanacetum coccineum]